MAGSGNIKRVVSHKEQQHCVAAAATAPPGTVANTVAGSAPGGSNDNTMHPLSSGPLVAGCRSGGFGLQLRISPAEFPPRHLEEIPCHHGFHG